MSWASRWRSERRQRRHHRAFRIAEPDWNAAERSRLAGLLAEFVRSAEQATRDTTTRVRPGLSEKDLAEAATNLWRARRRITRLSEENSREAKRVGRYLLATQEALDAAGLLIQDHDGTQFHPGQSLEVLLFQDDPALPRPTVRETVRPTIYLSGRRIQMGQVIVGGPLDQNDSTMEESRA